MNFSKFLTIFVTTLGLVKADSLQTSFSYGSGTTVLSNSYEEYLLSNVSAGEASTELLEVRITGHADGTTIVDGNEEFSGFQVKGSSQVYNNVKFIVKDIAAFNNFKDTPDFASGMDGGGVFSLIHGGSIEFQGYDKDNRLQFNNAAAAADGWTAAGAAIWVEGAGQIGDIYADFTYNKITPNPPTDTTSYSRGGAISISNWYSSSSTSTTPLSIGNIYGNFHGNEAEYGGAIYVGPYATIGNIGGKFTNNAASVELGNSSTGGAGGGAIRLYNGKVGNVTASFDGNYSYVTVNELGSNERSTSSGGAIAMTASSFTDDNHGKFTGSFTNNIAFSVYSLGRGGAISIDDQSDKTKLSIIDADLIGNIAATSTALSSNAKGGAIYVENWFDLYVSALTRDVLISGNYEAWNASFAVSETDGSVSVSTNDINFNAIYAVNSTITFSTEGVNTITLNDSISGDGTGNIILQGNSAAEYDVMINAEIKNSSVEVQTGGLKLGTMTHSYTDKEKNTKEARMTAYLKNSSLNVGDQGTVNTLADYFKEATTITNLGNIEFTGGTLSRGINTTGALSGDLYIQGDTLVTGTSTAGGLIRTEMYSDNIYVEANLTLIDLASSYANTLIYTADTMYELNDHTQITLNSESVFEFNSIEMHIGSAAYDHFYDLIISDGTDDIIVDATYHIDFYLGGILLEKDMYITEILEDGGLRVRFIPEPSSATLSLLALASLLVRRRRNP